MNKTSTGQRLTDLRSKMQETGVDLVALAPGAHMLWLLGFHPHPDERPCLLLIGRESEAFLMPTLNAQGTREQTDLPFYEWSDEAGPGAALSAALQVVGCDDAKSIALDETMRADFALLLLDELPNANHRFTFETLGILRMRKDEGEYALLKESAQVADHAMLAGFAATKPGVKESEILEVIKDHFLSENAPLQFGIIGSGPNGAFPHHQTGERVIRSGEAIVMDIGGRKDGFPSDITRMAVVGTPPEGYEEIHAIVEAAVIAAMSSARPGVPACDVDRAARGVISKAGYGEYFVHRTGHGLGLEVHEPPYITSTSQTVLETGMVFSIEPGIYLPDRFGIRLEEIVILREDGPEILSSLPRTAHVLEQG